MEIFAKRQFHLCLSLVLVTGFFFVFPLIGLAEEVAIDNTGVQTAVVEENADEPPPVPALVLDLPKIDIGEIGEILPMLESGDSITDANLDATLATDLTSDTVTEKNLPESVNSENKEVATSFASITDLTVTSPETVISPEVDFNSMANTEPPQPEIEIAVSDESSFTTSVVSLPTSETAVSNELSVTTSTISVSELVISSEQSFSSLPVNPSSELAISGEFFFTSNTEPAGEIAISDEVSFNTLNDGGCGNCPPPPTPEIVISDELSFTTFDNSGPTTELAISDEMSFTTSVGELAISDEQSFTTSADNGGGGGGGGGSGGSGGRLHFPTQKFMCEPYLKEFIKFGANNNPAEVLKLKIFLNSFEGFNLPLTPFYDLATFQAVEAFQRRHSSDILSPWRIVDSTGFVYITTSIKINYIVCGITDSIDLSLFAAEDLVRIVPAAAGVIQPGEILTPDASGDVGLNFTDIFALLRTFGGQNFSNNTNSNFTDRLVAGLPFLFSFDWLFDFLNWSSLVEYLKDIGLSFRDLIDLLLLLLIILFGYLIHRRSIGNAPMGEIKYLAAGEADGFQDKEIEKELDYFAEKELQDREIDAVVLEDVRLSMVIPMPEPLRQNEKEKKLETEKTDKAIDDSSGRKTKESDSKINRKVGKKEPPDNLPRSLTS